MANESNDYKPTLKVVKGLGHLQPLSDEEEAELEIMEAEYMEDVKLNRDCGSQIKYKKYFEYVYRWRYYYNRK